MGGWGAEIGRHVASVISRRIVMANLVGAVGVFTILTFLSPGRDVAGNNDTVSLGIFVGYLAIVMPLELVVTSRWTAPLLGWLRDERRPSEAERAIALRLPVRVAGAAFVAWLGAIAIFSPLQLVYGNPPVEALRVGLGILVAGVATCTLVFLLVERTMRPVFTLALAGEAPERPVSLGVRSRLLLSWALGSALPLVAVGMTQLGRTPAERADLVGLTWAVVVGGLVAGGTAITMAAGSVADPLEMLRRAARRVGQGDTDVRVPVDDAGEVGLLEAGFNRMVEGLRERQRLQELFGHHVGEEVARRALENPAMLGGEQREASALFVDVVASTAVAHTRPATEVVALLNAMFDAVVRVVGDEGGWVNKFEGDGALAVFGAPMDDPDHAAHALRAARRLRAELVELAGRFPDLDAGIGVSSGQVVAGNVGAAHRYEYTVIGDAVNEAARLTDLAKERPGRVLAGQSAIDAAGAEGTNWAPSDVVVLRGRPEPTKTFEPDLWSDA